MPEGLAVDGDGEDLVVAARWRRSRTSSRRSNSSASREAMVESERARDGAVVEEDDDFELQRRA